MRELTATGMHPMALRRLGFAIEEARDFSADQRKDYAKRGVALPDGSFPIPDRDALERAIKLAGHASNPSAAKAHIKKRASALGLTNLLPKGW